ncbi:HEAT repeat domain-containing protein [Solibacillus sp. FSL W8-0474]|uniref:HEAT repeat domain-containing protein n=1 Tax=Solibacillus sp. FSL W8-0474 TaxID=2975336 RepID=UPI0030FCEF63
MIDRQFLIGTVIIGIMMLIVIFCIFLYLVYKGMERDRINEKMNAYFERYKTGWYKYLVYNEPFDHRPENKISMKAIDHLFISYLTTVNNEAIHTKVSEYASLNMQDYYIEQIKSRDRSVRLNVLQRTLLMELDFLVPIIEQHLRNKRDYDMEEYLLMLRVVAKYNRNMFFAHVYQPRLPFDDYEYKLLLSTIDDSYIDYFTNHFDTLPMVLKLALLDYLSLSTNVSNDSLSFYERLLTSDNQELRIRVLKAIASFGMISDLQRYEHFVASTSWEERLMMARILRFAKEEQSYQNLQRLIADSNWKVRKQAALSLLNMPKGKVILQQIIDSKEDSYAADIAREVMKLG